MHRHFLLSSLLMTCLLCVSANIQGCRPAGPPPPPTGDALIESIKANLNGVIELGEGGSALDVLRNDFERLQEENPDKAATIEPEFKELMQANDAEKRKGAAKAMQSKL